MPRFIITEKAGLYVAGYRNNGVGTALDLTEKQAEHELRLGTLIRSKDEADPAPVAEEDFAPIEDEGEDAPEVGAGEAVEPEEADPAPDAPEPAPVADSAPQAAKKGRRR